MRAWKCGNRLVCVFPGFITLDSRWDKRVNKRFSGKFVAGKSFFAITWVPCEAFAWVVWKLGENSTLGFSGWRHQVCTSGNVQGWPSNFFKHKFKSNSLASPYNCELMTSSVFLLGNNDKWWNLKNWRICFSNTPRVSYLRNFGLDVQSMLKGRSHFSYSVLKSLKTIPSGHNFSLIPPSMHS